MVDKHRMKLFKATIKDEDGEVQVVPVWAQDLDTAYEAAEAEYGEVERVRPEVTQ